MIGRPAPALLASVDLPPDVIVESAGGATGQVWKVTTPDGPCALRRGGSAESAATELATMAAARAAGLPVPDVIRHGTSEAGEAVLLSWLPGMTMVDALRSRPERAHTLGLVMGEAQRQLHTIAAPAGLPTVTVGGMSLNGAVAGSPVSGLGGVLLHLDWHLLNLLVDGDRVSGIVDWTNARAGDPLLDLARSHCLFTVDPALATLTPVERRLLAEVHQGWVAGYGPTAASIPAPYLAWAGRTMLADQASRYATNPAALDELRRWTEGWQSRVGPVG
ncbi:phosphotransferase family protein [Actinopolymorpha alba]|uniref:phosphotransferase family protein n=1 Tax=Actinopolymorpha alba TaxID=533267 RepID=UPI000367592F|nr:phosphotransferase [Actinopolymorpha alba]